MRMPFSVLTGRRAAGWFFCLLAMLSMIACQSKNQAVRPSLAAPADLKQRIDRGPWRLEGKMALSDGSQSGSGRLRWQKYDGLNSVQLKAPLGQGQWELQETPEGAILHSSRRGTVTADSAAELLRTEIGWEVPWAAMQHWLFGQTATGGAETQIKQTSDQGGQRVFEENGWHIVYSRYKVTPLGLLPHKIVAWQGAYQVKVFISLWQFPQSAGVPAVSPVSGHKSRPETDDD